VDTVRCKQVRHLGAVCNLHLSPTIKIQRTIAPLQPEANKNCFMPLYVAADKQVTGESLDAQLQPVRLRCWTAYDYQAMYDV
jgi:hypothetical protein